MDAATSFLWGKGSFVSFCFDLNSFTCLLFVEGWERVVCVVCSPPPCFSFAKAHRRNLCLLHYKQKNCPHTVNHEHCFHINSSFGGLFVSFFFHFGLGLVCLKNKIINFQEKKRLTKTNLNWLVTMLCLQSEQSPGARSLHLRTGAQPFVPRVPWQICEAVVRATEDVIGLYCAL